MLLTVKEAAGTLLMELHQIYYLLIMGEIEAIKVGKTWRLAPDAVSEYVKQHPERKNREPSGYFIYPGNCGFLFGCLSDSLPSDPHGKNSGMERRRRQLVHRARRSHDVLLKELKSITQFELFTA